MYTWGAFLSLFTGSGKRAKEKKGGKIRLVAWFVYFSFPFFGASIRMGACASQGSETLFVYFFVFSLGTAGCRGCRGSSDWGFMREGWGVVR